MMNSIEYSFFKRIYTFCRLQTCLFRISHEKSSVDVLFFSFSFSASSFLYIFNWTNFLFLHHNQYDFFSHHHHQQQRRRFFFRHNKIILMLFRSFLCARGGTEIENKGVRDEEGEREREKITFQFHLDHLHNFEFLIYIISSLMTVSLHIFCSKKYKINGSVHASPNDGRRNCLFSLITIHSLSS